MTSNQTEPSELTVACHVRAPLVLEPVDSKVETLRQCERDGRIGSLVLRSWPEEVDYTDDSSYQEVVDRFEEFERWADRRGATVRPPFRTRTSTSLVTDEQKELLVTPTICLSLYDDDRLVGVFPHNEGDTTYTVPDAIAALRTGRIPRPIDDAVTGELEPDRRETDDTTDRAAPLECPDCGAERLNVQGIDACVACRWTDGSADVPAIQNVQ